MRAITIFFLLFCCVSGAIAQSSQAWRSYEQALNQYKAENYDSAIPYLNEAIEASPDFTDAYHMLAVCYDERGDVKLAINNYEKALAEKEDEKALYNLGLLYLSDNQEDKALKVFQKSVDLSPDYKKPLRQIALLEAQMGESSAEADADVFLGAADGEGVRLYSVVDLYEQGMYQEAIDQSHKIRPADVNAKVFYMRGICYEKLKDKDAAIDEHFKAISFDNTYLDAYTRLGMLHFNKSDYVEAYKHFARASELDINDYELIQYAGRSAYYAERYDDAITFLNNYLDQQPQDGQTHYLLAASYSKKGNEARSRQHLDMSADLGYAKAIEKISGQFIKDEPMKAAAIPTTRGMSKKELKAAKRRMRD